MSQFKTKDAKGNILNVGDRVKCIDNKQYEKQLTFGKIYNILKINNNISILLFQDDLNHIGNAYSWRFTKVNNCLKIKIRKLKKLIKSKP